MEDTIIVHCNCIGPGDEGLGKRRIDDEYFWYCKRCNGLLRDNFGFAVSTEININFNGK